MLLALILVFFFISKLSELLLLLLNYYSLERSYRCESFPEHLPKEDWPKIYQYQCGKHNLALLRDSLSLGLLILLLGLGVPALVYQSIGEQLLPLIPSLNVDGVVHTTLFLLLLQLASMMISLPFSIYSSFVLEERFGFNKMRPRDFVLDTLKGLLLGLIFGLPILLGLNRVIQTVELWWLWATAGLSAYQLLIFWLYPVLIAPLFNRFSPLDEGALKQRLEGLLQQTGFRAQGLFVMDGSKRSKHSNAYFTGFGRSRRIVLFDTLLDELNEDQLAAVLAHEIGHYKKRHIVKNFWKSIFALLLSFLAIYFLSRWTGLFLAFGFEGMNSGALLFLAMILGEAGGLWLNLITNNFSRKYEYEADEYAAQTMEGSQYLEEALCTLHRENYSHPAPHKAYTSFYFSHPSLSERLAALRKWSPLKSAL